MHVCLDQKRVIFHMNSDDGQIDILRHFRKLCQNRDSVSLKQKGTKLCTRKKFLCKEKYYVETK